MLNVIEALLAEADRREAPLRGYYEDARTAAGSKLPGIAGWRDQLGRFLRSTMDEVRLRAAQEFALTTLGIHDLLDADHFRQGVLRREASGDIAYDKQRDHSAHTVNNWLLGWYFFGHVPKFVAALSAAKNARKNPRTNAHFFGGAWQFCSLLHDIGYLFEGSLAALDPVAIARQPQIGLSVLKDYFRHRLWQELGLLSNADRQRALDLADVKEPEFVVGDTLTGIARVLRQLPDLERLREAVLATLNVDPPDCVATQGGLPSDAIDIWRKHYEKYSPKMVRRIDQAEREFYRLIQEGIANGLRVLDHGVCSGLLLLLITTYYYRFHHGMTKTQPDGSDRQRVWKKIRDETPELDPSYWWQGLVWATAATALHNLLQSPGGRGDLGQLSLDEDPLAYLGILVDLIQEWDRYAVSRASFLGHSKPIQGVDVELGHANDHVVVDYRDENRAKEVREALDATLLGWSELVVILPAAPEKSAEKSA